LVSKQLVRAAGFSCALLETAPAAHHYGFKARHLRFSLKLGGETVLYPSPGHRPLAVDPRSVFVTPPGICWEGGWQGRATLLVLQVGEALCREVGGRRRWLPGTQGVAVVDDERLAHGLKLVYEDLLAGSPAGPRVSEYLIRGVTAHYLETHCRAVGEPARPGRAAAPVDWRRVEECIEANLHERLSLPAQASRAGLSVAALCRVIRQHTGRSAHQFLIARRVERAKEELRKGEVSLRELALQLGFYDQSQFTSAFRRRVGVTPAVFRRG